MSIGSLQCRYVILGGARHEIQRSLGAGSSKVVYLAEDSSGEGVAVSFQELTKDRGEQVARELANLAKCRKIQGVTHLKEDIYCIEDGVCFTRIVTDLCDQGTLFPWSQGKTLRARLQILLQVAETVRRLQREGLLHGDIKSGNIGIQTTKTEGMQAILLDLGSMMSRSEIKDAPSINGSPAYLPPGSSELQGNCSNPLVRDVFALGATIYEIVSRDSCIGALSKDVSRLTGREANPYIYLLNTKQNEIHAAIENLDTHPSMKQLLQQMLILDPEKRCSIEYAIGRLHNILTRAPKEVLNECAEKIPEPGAPLLKDASKPRFEV